jgi:hypothetical protein
MCRCGIKLEMGPQLGARSESVVELGGSVSCAACGLLYRERDGVLVPA